MFNKKIIFYIVLACLLIADCKKDVQNNDGIKQTIIPESTIIFTENEWNLSVTKIDTPDYTLTFNKDYNFNIGDVIASQAGEGYLRKIIDVDYSDNDVIVKTKQASFVDAIESCDTTFSIELTTDKIAETAYIKKGTEVNVSKLKGTDGIEFIDYNINTSFADGLIEISGNLSIKPILEIELIIDYFSIDKLDVGLGISEECNINAEVNYNVDFEHEEKIYGHYFHPYLITIFGVPSIVTPEIELFAGVSSSCHLGVSSSIYQELSYTAGILYENSKWSQYSEITNSFDYEPPTLLANANFVAYIRPQLNFKINGVLSPYISGRLFGELDADINETPWWTLYIGANAYIGIEADIFDNELFDYYTDPPLIEYKIPIAQATEVYENQAPESPSDPNPENNATDVAIETELSWDCIDPENDPLTYDIYFGLSSPPPLLQSELNDQTFDPGTLEHNTTYYWKIVAKDGINETEGDIWSFTTLEQANGDTNIITDYEGNVYNTVKIGDQLWMAENLAATKYNDGTDIPEVTGDLEWWELKTPAYCWYKNNESIYKDLYGALYNGYAVTTGNLCPIGWHVPTDDEWKQLEMYLGMSQSEADNTWWRGTNEGGKLMEAGTDHWYTPNSGATNESGFTALPGGYRNNTGCLNHLVMAHFWSSTDCNSDEAWYRHLWISYEQIKRNCGGKNLGFSIRCIKD
jgi:uncharacterized protein (TIGR02145 family)